MKNISFLTVVTFLFFSASVAMAATATKGLTIDVTGPGGIGVKEVQPGLITGEIWATVTGDNENLDDESLKIVTGGLQLTGDGSFLPFDTSSNYEAAWSFANMNPVDISTDGKTLGHGGAPASGFNGCLNFRSGATEVLGNGPFKLGTFQAELLEGDSVQFLMSAKSITRYTFKIDNTVRNGISGYEMIHLGAPLVAVPEPSTFVLLGMGVIGVFAWLRQRGRKG